jgi:hypothetical protein
LRRGTGRPDILKWRWAWFETRSDLEPDRLVFIDDSRRYLGQGFDADGTHLWSKCRIKYPSAVLFSDQRSASTLPRRSR